MRESWRTRALAWGAALATAGLLQGGADRAQATPGRPRPTPHPRTGQQTATGGDAPDVAFQFSMCLTDEYRRKVRSNLRRALRAAGSEHDPDPDVRSRCIEDGPNAGREIVGAWREPLPDAGSAARSAARDAALAPLTLLQEGEAFAGRVSYALLRTFANQAWDDMPKRLAKSGRPDRNGPIRLRTFTFWFTDGNEVKTHVTGDYQQGISVGFDFTATDAMSTSRGELVVRSARDLDVDETPLAVLTVALTAVFPPLGALGLRLMVLAGNEEEVPPDPGTSVGAMLVQMFPREIMVSGGQKAAFSYGRLQLSPLWAVSAGGGLRFLRRDPGVEIEGARDVWIRSDDPPKRITFRALPRDLRPNLTGSWTVDGRRANPRAGSPTSETIAFDVPHGARRGALFTHRVGVALTDADDLTASAAVDVRVHVADPPTPLCQEHPHLPQCEHRSGGN